MRGWSPDRLLRGDRGPLIVRVVGLLPADPDAVSVAAGRLTSSPDAIYLARTGAGTVLTLETRLDPRRPFRRTRAIRDLQTCLAVIERELESRAMPTSRAQEHPC